MSAYRNSVVYRPGLLKNGNLILDDSTSAVDTATDAKIRRPLREDYLPIPRS